MTAQISSAQEMMPGGLEDIKAEVEETLSEGRPSSPHAANPYAPQDTQVSDRDAQTER